MTASDQHSAQELVDRAWKAHSDAMMALAADVHPYSPSAVRDQEALLERTLGELGTRLMGLEEQLEARERVLSEVVRLLNWYRSGPGAPPWEDVDRALIAATSNPATEPSDG